MRFRKHDLDGGDQPLLHVFLNGSVFILLGQFGQLSGVLKEDVVDSSSEGTVEAGCVGAALAGRNGVDERLDPGVVTLDPAEGYLDGALAVDVYHLPVNRHPLGELRDTRKRDDLAGVVTDREMIDQVGQSSTGYELERLAATGPLVNQTDLHAGHQEARLHDPLANLIGIDTGISIEDLAIRPVADPGARLVLGDPLHPCDVVTRGECRTREVAGHSLAKRQFVGVPVPVNLGHQLGGQGVYN